jgi:acetyl-CoA carboxylase biotin carboxyl carrier protein
VTEGKPPRRTRRTNKLDLAEINRLAELMERMDLVEVEIEQEGKRVHVVRTSRHAPPVAAAGGAWNAGPEPPQPPAAAGHGPAQAARGVEVTSPMVGTFYRSASPDAAPFVEVGDRVARETVVCIVEAMKVMNEIKAEVEGEVLEILVQNGEPVEFGQPLFLVRRAGSAA